MVKSTSGANGPYSRSSKDGKPDKAASELAGMATEPVCPAGGLAGAAAAGRKECAGTPGAIADAG